MSAREAEARLVPMPNHREGVSADVNLEIAEALT